MVRGDSHHHNGFNMGAKDETISPTTFSNLSDSSNTRSGTNNSPENDIIDGAHEKDAATTDVTPDTDAVARPTGPPPISNAKKGLIAGLLSLSVLIVALDQTIVTTSLPDIVAALKSSSGYSWVGAAYTLACAGVLPAYGRFADIFGRKITLMVAILLFILGSGICGGASSINMLIGGRVVQGLGGGGISALVNIIISDIVALHQRGAFMGMLGATWAIGGAIGPLIGGALTQNVSWRWCFYLNLPIAGFTMCMLFLLLKNNKGLEYENDTRTVWQKLLKIDFCGIILVAGATVLLLLALDWGGTTHPWGSGIIIAFLVVAFVLYGIFLTLEWFQDQRENYPRPIMPPSLFANKTRLGGYLFTFFHSIVFMCISYFMPFMYQSVYGKSPMGSAVYLLPQAFVTGGLSAGAGIFIAKTGHYLPVMWISSVIIIVFTGMLSTLDETSNVGKRICYVMAWGAGIGPVFQAPLVVIHTQVERKNIAISTTTWSFVRMLGMSIGISIGGVVFQNQMEDQISDPAIIRQLPEWLLEPLSGTNAAAATQMLNNKGSDISAHVLSLVRYMYSHAFKYVFYTCLGLCGGLLSVLLIGKHQVKMRGDLGKKEKQEKREAENRALSEQPGESV